MMQELDPDLVFLSTPHGLRLSRDFGVAVSPFALGSATIGQDTQSTNETYTLTTPRVPLDSETSSSLVGKLKGFNVSAIEVPPGSLYPLGWAEVIPLMVLPTLPNRTLLWSHPIRRYNESQSMIPELLELGRGIRKFLDELPLRVVVLISGDLAHTHRPDGPYGYSSTSSLFDTAVGHWASDPCHNAHYLLETARDLVPSALSCAFTGLVLLHGMLPCDTQVVVSSVQVNTNVTYFGMMVANMSLSRVQHDLPAYY